MEELKVNIRLFSGILGGVFGAVSEDSNALLILLLFVAIMGLGFSPEIRDVFRKCFIILLCVLGTAIDLYVIKSGFVIKNAVICFYIANEIIVITERIGLSRSKRKTE